MKDNKSTTSDLASNTADSGSHASSDNGAASVDATPSGNGIALVDATPSGNGTIDSCSGAMPSDSCRDDLPSDNGTVDISGDIRLSDQGGADRINNISMWLKRRFGRKMIKLSIDGDFTCPNRDGTKGTGGCLFCGDAAGGDFASDIDTQIKMYSVKWPDAGYLAYFQNHTNTYAPVSELKEKYYSILSDPRISGIVIATRPDCLDDDVLDLLSEINHSHFMWVELGLQTMHDRTAELINRCYPLSVYDEAMDKLNSRGIKTVTHVILGLPGESREDMLETVRHTVQKNTWGLKLHMLNVVKGSRLALEMPDYIPFDSMEEYISLVADILEIIPPEITIHRLTADAPRKTLIAPEWSYMKRSILNGIHRELRERGSRQGSAL